MPDQVPEISADSKQLKPDISRRLDILCEDPWADLICNIGHR
jgi:hypothetical protein